jgi:hypothetical protein
VNLGRTLRRYAVHGHTVDRKHYERYFEPINGEKSGIPIKARLIF